MAIEIQGVYDGVLYWACLLCRRPFHRWSAGYRLRTVAARHIGDFDPGWFDDEK